LAHATRSSSATAPTIARSTRIVLPTIASRAGITVTPHSFFSGNSRRSVAATSCSSRSAAASAIPSRTRATANSEWPDRFSRSAAVSGIGTHTCCCTVGNMNPLGMTPTTVYGRSSSTIVRPEDRRAAVPRGPERMADERDVLVARLKFRVREQTTVDRLHTDRFPNPLETAPTFTC
jgi:hypothetical protein